MKQVACVEELLDLAIGREQAAADFYSELADTVSKPWIAQELKKFAQEELGHKNKLQEIKAGKQLAPASGKIQDLKIAEVKEQVKIGPDMDYGQVLIVAMKREKAAFKLYSDLAASTDDAKLRETFELLAQEEAKHKLRFEIEYDEHVQSEN